MAVGAEITTETNNIGNFPVIVLERHGDEMETRPIATLFQCGRQIKQVSPENVEFRLLAELRKNLGVEAVERHANLVHAGMCKARNHIAIYTTRKVGGKA